MKRGGFAPGRHRFKGEGKGRIAALSIAVYVCEGCGFWVGAAKPAQCDACGRMNFVRFDSRAEAKRWAELELWQRAGHISELRRQVRYPLLAPGPDGRPVEVAVYVADFVYRDERGNRCIEDCKGGAITDVAALKLRWMHAQLGVEVKLTKAA